MSPANKCNGMTLDADLNLIVCEHWTSHVVRAKLNPDGTEASREIDRLALPGQGAELAERRRRQERRLDLLHRPDVRAHGGLREPARAGPRLPGRLPATRRRRRPRAARRRLRSAERPLLLAGRVGRSTSTTPGRCNIRAFDVQRGRYVSTSARMLVDDAFRRLAPDLRRDEVRRAREHLGHRPRRHLVFDPDGEHLGTVEVPEHDRQPDLGRPELGRPLCARVDVRLPLPDEGERQPPQPTCAE